MGCQLVVWYDVGGCEDPRANGVGIDFDVEGDRRHLSRRLEEGARSSVVERQCESGR